MKLLDLIFSFRFGPLAPKVVAITTYSYLYSDLKQSSYKLITAKNVAKRALVVINTL